MKIIFSLNIFILIFLLSCTGQNKAFIPDPDFSVYAAGKTIVIDDIIETKTNVPAGSMPEWLLMFAEGGNKAVEQIDSYKDKYVFVGVNEGANFLLLNKWAENFTAEQDFAILAAVRIEERMIQGASLYPDDEYGAFFLSMVKKAYSAEYPNALKDDTYWFRKASTPEVINFFILITIDKNTMQAIIRNMMTQAYTETSPRGAQGLSVNRLRQNFFEGF